MLVTRADREAGAPIEVGYRVEVADRMDDVVETMRHAWTRQAR
jgi:hypothetical protein